MAEQTDFLIVGGGSAGAIVARRLADRNIGRVLLIEAGRADEGDPAATDLYRLDEQTPESDWGLKARPLRGGQSHLNYARAKLLGGCANHNDCAFLRPPPSDFDGWEKLGASGWNAKAMAPYFDRVMERTSVEPAPQHPVSRAFVDAACELGLEELDFSKEIRQGAGWFPLNAKGRQRRSSSITYLHPLSALPQNLQVWTNTTASRLLFENGRAIGAETSRGTVLARRAVVLTAGAIQTPQLLMVSGVGPADQLRRFGIPIVRDAPQVGQHLLDHVAAPVVWETCEPIAPWMICPFEATLLLQLDPTAPAPDILFHFGLRVREKYADGPRLAVNGPAIKASPNVARARSEGELRLAGPHFATGPVIDLNYLSDPHDLPLLRLALRFARQLGQTTKLGKYIKREAYPGAAVQSDIEWDHYIRSVCETVYHPCGTAAIGRVVSPDLKLNGLEGLFVADASVFPSMITVNINCAVMMVAEKAADHIARSST